jgi:hypothetical protein
MAKSVDPAIGKSIGKSVGKSVGLVPLRCGRHSSQITLQAAIISANREKIER